MLQQIGRIAPDIKQLIISNLIRSPKIAKFSSGGSLFHFKGSICVKKLGCFLRFCSEAPHLYKNPAQINCSK
jgi:hypothetical protein